MEGYLKYIVGQAVGGFMETVNKLTVLAPYLALFGVVVAAVVAARQWKNAAAS